VIRKVIVVAAFAAVAFGAAAAAAQTQAAYNPPKTADGQPDIQGIWQVLNTAAWDLEDHGATLGVPAGHGVVDGGPIPYQPAATAPRRLPRAATSARSSSSGASS